MRHFIYNIPKPDNPIKIDSSSIMYDEYPSPKLIKYGFNQEIAKLDLMKITNNPYYKTGLALDTDRTDDNSIVAKLTKLFGDKISINKSFCSMWELVNIFDLVSKCGVIYTNIPDTIKDIITVHKKIIDINGTSKCVVSNSNNNHDSDLVIYEYSSADVDENAIIDFLANDLKKLIDKQHTGSNMILQLFDCQTEITIEFIQYLSSLYEETYIFKPFVSSSLSEEKYLILINMKPDISPLDIPTKTSVKSGAYITKIIPNGIAANLTMIIQCINSILLPNKFTSYYTIKSYLDGKVYEGATYQTFISAQNNNIDLWIEIFGKPDKNAMEKILETALSHTNQVCNHEGELVNLYGGYLKLNNTYYY
jgi:hypothetical protein